MIVPARDAESTIAQTLEALASQQSAPAHEVIVVDAGSADRTASIASGFEGVEVIRATPLGPGAARNLGASRSAGSLLAFVDADCVPSPGWLAAGWAAGTTAELVQGRVETATRPGSTVFDRTVRVGGPSPLYEAANMFVSRAAFSRAGGFCDWLDVKVGNPHFGEDTDFGWRVRRQGGRVAFAPDAVVEHALIARSGRGMIAERLRLFYFPALVRRVPELRRAFFFGRVFLTRRSAAFDLALIAAGVALGFGGWVAAISAFAALPYLAMLGARARQMGRWAPRVLSAEMAADLVGLIALLAGSVRYGRTVL